MARAEEMKPCFVRSSNYIVTYSAVSFAFLAMGAQIPTSIVLTMALSQ